MGVTVDDQSDASSHGDSPESLMAEVRAHGFVGDRSIDERISRLLDETTDRGDIGTLYTVRAIAFQGHGDATTSAEAAVAAVPHLVAAARTAQAAFASAMAAVFLDQCGRASDALDYAVDALVLLADAQASGHALTRVENVRAGLALSGFFMRRSAFEQSMQAARRAFDEALLVPDLSMEAIAFSYGYVASEASHVSGEPSKRAENLAAVETVIAYLVEHVERTPACRLLENTLRGEARHARGDASNDLRLDACETVYSDASEDLVAWNLLVRGTSALLDDRPSDAIALLDRALPGLEASADHHCVVRALRNRSIAFAALGDHASAHRDSLALADRVRRWQVDQVGGLADQLARRAELERSTSELAETAARLADDIDRDSTTGVRSRRWLERHLDDLSESDGIGAVVMCDLDRFKAVNDEHGHHVGDRALHEFASLIDRSIAHAGVVARFGGEEFVIVLESTDAHGATTIAERTRHIVNAHDWTHLGPGLQLSMSCGVAAGRLASVRSLLVDADQSLLDAKRRGRNRVVATFVSED